jgi:hypothetical protein
MATTPSNRALTASERIYRAMLLMYPKPFRQSYGQEMAQIFRDCCRETLRDGNRLRGHSPTRQRASGRVRRNLEVKQRGRE